MVAAVTLAVVLTRPDGAPSAGAEVFLQPAAAAGPDPFTESTVVKEDAPPPVSPAPSPTTTGSAPAPDGTTTGTRSVSGSAPGVYGGTQDVASCDVEKQITVLAAEPAKNEAFASTLGIQPAAVPGYLRSLTPVQLRLDTRVTNHGFQNGKVTSYQAVLQAGTAVLVDDRGVPRVRCACGNPLGPPVPLKAAPKRYGQTWPSYQPAKVVVIAPAVQPMKKIVIYDHQNRHWLERDKGPHQDRKPDRPIPPPVVPTPPTSPSPTVTPTHTGSKPPGPPSTSPTPTGSTTPTPTPTTTPTPTPTTTPTPTPTSPTSPPVSPSPSTTPSPTPTPSASPSASPSQSPSGSPPVSPTPPASGSPSPTVASSPSSAEPPSGSPSEPPSPPGPGTSAASPSTKPSPSPSEARPPQPEAPPSAE
ncbi:hypothetical protein AW27_031025 [Streptomyces sp. PCS3-D2]|uniref:DUF6777 domain-containing protein n=1 Tax=Streptomyces sp. PCS3-D2 TaxID=1460244 RepID=UPI000B1BF35B|nr:DUF6777 domain-containing protein [Streptomyces sp. PCS3-D2]WKV75569.1 hypothetical protein AW27_031025 [Streptomyces sp. PCS3-D2]